MEFLCPRGHKIGVVCAKKVLLMTLVVVLTIDARCLQKAMDATIPLINVWTVDAIQGIVDVIGSVIPQQPQTTMPFVQAAIRVSFLNVMTAN